MKQAGDKGNLLDVNRAADKHARMSDEPTSPEIEIPKVLGAGARSTNVWWGVGIFVLGLVAGVPLALVSLDAIIDNALVIFLVLFGLLLLAGAVVIVIIAFRRPILQTVVKRSEVEMERFARPMAEVAKHAAAQRVAEATEAARELGELMLARYAWVATRRWMVATITAFIASIAALAGSALLFQQNQLLRTQIGLMQQQNDRFSDQNALFLQQIELGDAQRSAGIVPEILEIGSLLGSETTKLAKDGRPAPIFKDEELSQALRSRIIAATNAARPYRYLASPIDRIGESELAVMSIERRADVNKVRDVVQTLRDADAEIGINLVQDGLIDRPTSPERGQIISLLYNNRVLSTGWLTLNGADFSFAEVRVPLLSVINLENAQLRFADFSGVNVNNVQLGAAYMEQTRFIRSIIAGSDLGGLSSDSLNPLIQGSGGLVVWHSQLGGADFRAAIISKSRFADANAAGANFDYALIGQSDFTNAALAVTTFRNAVIRDVDFTGADFEKSDFDGAYVFTDTFLDDMAREAANATFDASQYRLDKVGFAQLNTHPNSAQVWYLGDDIDENTDVWRVVRVKDINEVEAGASDDNAG
ncbi:MAG: pentapeptide repeat-containing protein [Hyphomicrobiaceae bacterium]|nr:pentapeptide repeat-containing protein [Hyphomicrobiaceae bacterium]MCC0024924.1 pentapeptide repeat-containing protein [Hyphomicrobiaceae bacterium]